MMRKIDKFEKVNEENFKRVVGVKRETFEVMVEEYKKAKIERRQEEENRNYVKRIESSIYIGIDYGISRVLAKLGNNGFSLVLFGTKLEMEVVL